jgi:hypothetical protein
MEQDQPQSADREPRPVTAVVPSGVSIGAGTSIGRSRHGARVSDPGLGPRRCLTCTMTLSAGVERYCNDACRLKQGRSKRAPGRTAARRRRRRGDRKR